MKASDANDMLRAMFWSGLRQQWKDIAGHLYDRITDVDELRVAIRRIEQDHRKAELTKSRSSVPSKSAVSTTSSLDELRGIVQQLSADEIEAIIDGNKVDALIDTGSTHCANDPKILGWYVV